MKIKKPELLIEAEKKLKKVGDFLRDKSVVSFTMSVKLYRDGLSAPKTIFMQGERSIDGALTTYFPRVQNQDAVQSRNALKGKLESIEERVHEYIVENALDAGWKKLEVSIDEALKSALSADDLEYRSFVPIHALAGRSYEAHFCAPVMATVYAKEGEKALAKGNLNQASYCVDRGLHWSSPEIFIPSPNGRFKERAGTGGVGKHLRHEPVKDKVVELLKELEPNEGWKSTSTAIESVANELISNHSRLVEECCLKTETLPRTIRGWIQANPKRYTHHIKSKI